MKDNANSNPAPVRPDNGNAPANDSLEQRHLNPDPSYAANQPTGKKNIDLWMVLDLLLRRWLWLVLGSALCGGLFFLLGSRVVRPKFTASAQLLRYEAPGKSEYFKTTPIAGETLAALLRAPDLLQKVGSQVNPPIPPETLTKCLKVDPEPDSDVVKVLLAARTPESAVSMLNLYISNAVEYTRDLEAKQAARLAEDYLKKQVAAMNHEIGDLEKRFRNLPPEMTLTNGLAQVGGRLHALNTNLGSSPQPSMLGFSRAAQKLQATRSELEDLLRDYTDLHPRVQAKREAIKELEAQIAAASTNTNLAASPPLLATSKAAGEGLDPELDLIHIKMRALEDGRIELAKRQREAELYASDPPGNVRVFAPATLDAVKQNFRNLKIALVTIFGSGLGLGASILLVLLLEFVDPRLKTPHDITRVTHLPVLTALGDLQAMPPHDRAQWAFRTWTLLQGRLSPSPNYGLVCGVTSSSAGEGRSTWISLLAQAASLTGFRVLTIATRPSPTHIQSTDEMFEEVGSATAELEHGAESSSAALTSSVLASPALVTEQLTAPDSQPVVHIPLPGWVWSLERRKQWREALSQWARIENLVIFVELPPACVPEAVLLGSNLPNMLWLTDSGVAQAAETRAQLATLRDARCNLVGAVLNRQTSVPIRSRFPRWLAALALLAAFGLPSALAQESNSPAAQPAEAQVNSSASTTEANPHPGLFHPSQRAAWQQHLTLGPGDLLNFSLYDHPELGRADVAVGPDGRVSYLEAQDVLAAGLTIDELRAKFDQEIGKYRRAPHTIITPVAFKSKKYYMLGKVATKGVFTLERPLTVVEALARAHGLESALIDRNVVTLTDFQRSFVARGGRRINLNFEKLFQQGDLSQNIAVEPGDYIYFAPGDVKEVYVVGEVRLPGVVTFYQDLTIIGAIAARGGYSERAYKARVVVLRGPLNNPEKLVVDTHAILDAKQLNFKLQPKDVIFVNSRPFIKVEEAADLAATAFIQSIIAEWVGIDVVKPFTQ